MSGTIKRESSDTILPDFDHSHGQTAGAETSVKRLRKTKTDEQVEPHPESDRETNACEANSDGGVSDATATTADYIELSSDDMDDGKSNATTTTTIATTPTNVAAAPQPATPRKRKQTVSKTKG